MWHPEKSPVVTNVDINGYILFTTESLSQNGGVGIYVKSSINSIDRIDLNYKCYDFETVDRNQSFNDKKMLFCCI